ncbi:hypothetical protein GCM10007418_01340 [Halopseudomonas salina]|uniref:Uncharacterized protein n=1 Tax=Halopseudomonas salina TaxID=1323744 RepID=A0ABQ1NUW0_9GAMM|nr:hypothetical protein GCM10007418_01340 [Halopseudomonas salina]
MTGFSAASAEPQAASYKPQAASHKPQATSQKLDTKVKNKTPEKEQSVFSCTEGLGNAISL